MPETIAQPADKAEANAPAFAMIAEFADTAELYHAAEKTRDAGYSRWDVFSPFPIHGMDAAMGLSKSPLAWFVFFGGLTGAMVALGLQYWSSVIDYPLIVQGKPYFSLPAFFPIIFELTILLSAFTTFFGLWLLCRLPQFNHKIFAWDGFKRATDDAFFLAIESSDPKFSAEETRKFLTGIGAMEINLIHEEEER